ncbi:MAG: FadR family transcriptional regulator [Clostridiales bacterium]|nr:FadR family transcriptional regulator [Clostridiales bacterium]
MQTNEKTYEIVIETIKKMILEGTVAQGDRLPPERQLALDLKVSRTSIREALKTLEVIGLLERKHGGGTFIKNDFANALQKPLSLLLAFKQIEKREILELRTMIEAEMTYYAAMRITDSEIEELRQILNLMLEVGDEQISVQYDKQFHFAIAKASKNHIIQSFYQVIYDLLDQFIGEVRYYVALEDLKLVNVTHIKIFDAIAEKNPIKAKMAMTNHMNIVNKYFDLNMSK